MTRLVSQPAATIGADERGVSGLSPVAAATPPRRTLFYVGISLAALVVVFIGFAPRYYLKAQTGSPAVRPFIHLHALVFTSWLLLFVGQTTLVAAGRTALHRRLGTFGGVLAALMLFLGVMTAIGGARNGWNPGGPFRDSLAFMVVPLGDILIFAGFVAAALWHRRRPELHRRLMLLGTVGGLLWPAIVRIPFIAGRFPLMMAALLPFLLASPIRDRLAGRRLHAVDLWGGLLVMLSVPVRTAIGMTDAWHSLASWMVR